jgi:rare lipoprotein A
LTGPTDIMGTMRRHILPSLLAAAALLAGCTESKVVVDQAKVITNPGPAKPAPYKIGKPYQVNDIWYYPKADYRYSETGIASWYGPGFHGKNTANGEVYDENGLTAAHKTLPMPSMVRVTNLENGRSIQVRVNDRGPFEAGRIIDMTRRGAQLLGFIDRGTARVRVDIMPEESQQLAALSSRQGGDQLPPPPEAAPVGAVEAGGLAPIAGAKVSPGKPAQPVPAAPAAQPGTNIAAVALPQPDGRVTQVPVRPTSIYIQAGAFTRQANANQLSAQLRKYGAVNIAPVYVEQQRFFRVRVGPISTVEQADNTLKRMIADGHPESRIVVD